jgi:cardiolipin synthase
VAVPSIDPPLRPAPSAVDPAPQGDPSRILTVPNLITLVRLLCLPAFVWLLFARDDRVGAAILLAALGATDWCDGYIARHFHQQSDLGKIFDPTADRLLFFVAVVSILIDGSAPFWFCIVVLAREITVATITVVLTALGSNPPDVLWWGKAGTLCLMFAFPWFLAGSSDVPLAPLLSGLAWAAGLLGIACSYYAAFRYVPIWRANLAAARSERI